jgi:hypothetical protein
MIETSLRSLDRLAVVGDRLPGHDWTRRLLLVGWAARFPETVDQERLGCLASLGAGRIAGPVVILAGGCDASVEQAMQGYRELLLAGLREFRGTLVSGGTTVGISGLAGEIQQEYPDAIHAIGYVPQAIPDGVAVDERYREIRRTAGRDFSPLEPLQYWADLLASGVRPEQVKLLGINGGAIAAAEYRIALALGARVGVIEDSGRAVDGLLADPDWKAAERLTRLPADAMTLAAFVGPGRRPLAQRRRETLGHAIHEAFCRVRLQRRADEDPSLAEWDRLPEELKESNRQQADDIEEKLRRIGCSLHEVSAGQVSLARFTEAEVEIMAEMEHARWMIERLGEGWTFGEKRDVAKKISPYLVPWNRLPEDVKEWDREMVRRIPEFLAAVGVEVRRKT